MRAHERRCKKLGLEVHRHILKQQQIKVVRMVDTAKADHYKKVISESDTRSMFHTVNTLVSSADVKLPNKVSGKELADRFVKYFSDA